ncbi:IS110 family transposase, partial [Myxococcota bacterium]|nr:IS110 family transposase [Myxococcota bacterium]
RHAPQTRVSGERQSRKRRRPVVKQVNTSTKSTTAKVVMQSTEVVRAARRSSEATFVGIDAHKERLHVAVLRAGEKVPTELSEPNNPTSIKRLARRLAELADGAEMRACYEAGPTGYGLHRALETAGIVCEVIAPSLIPQKAGDRVKTDRKDARKLAELYRAGMLTIVQPPTPAEEAARELVRARLSAQEDLTRARNRLDKMLLRHGRSYEGRPWTQAHTTWLQAQAFDQEATRCVYQEWIAECVHLESRVKRLESHVEQLAQTETYARHVTALRCLRGIGTLTAMALLTEIYQIRRFDDPRKLMAFLGLTPSEYSSGGKERRGSITKAGNSHVRRLLVEAAKHAQKKPDESREMGQRRKEQRADVVATARRAQERLHRRYWALVNRGKNRNVATIAVARELAGFIWSIMRTTHGAGPEVAASG